MNDFNGSVAQQDVTISTEVKKVATVGGNYYEAVLYVTDRFEDFGGDTPVYPVVTKDTYEALLDDYAYFSTTEKKLIKSNLASLFAYGTDLTVYIIPSTLVSSYKMRAYFTYLDLEWNTTDKSASDYALAASASTTLTNIKTFDAAFTQPITDMPVDPTEMDGASTTLTAATLALLTAEGIDLGVFARPAIPSGTANTANAYLDALGAVIGASPALYQIGRTLSYTNESGVPVGNGTDMDAIDFQNVLPTADVDTSYIEGCSAIIANWFWDVKVNYFKPVGNGTGQVNVKGGWTIFDNCITALWIVAYLNYMNRVSCATIITSGHALKDITTYSALLDAIQRNIARQMRNRRIKNFKLTAPSFTDLPKANGHTIVIPNAWEGTYSDNVRNVRVSGTLTVES